MGISIPSTAMLVELSQIFHTSTDYILGINTDEVLNISHLTEKEKSLIFNMMNYFESVRQKKMIYPKWHIIFFSGLTH